MSVKSSSPPPKKTKSKYTLPANASQTPKKPEEFKKLTHMYLNEKALYSIKPFQSCKYLTVLYLFNNEISKIENLDSLKNLTCLYLQSNKIKKIENLYTLAKLRKLYLGNNEISVIEGLEGLQKLEELHVEKQNLSKGDSLCFDPRSIITIADSLTVLNISGNNVTSLSHLVPLRFLHVINASDNKLNNASDVCNTIKGWSYLHEAMFAGNPMCKQHRWKEKIIASTKRLAVLDRKDVTDTTREFIQRMELEKALQKNSNFIEQPPGIPRSYPASLQRAVSRSIIKEIKDQQGSIDSDVTTTCDYVAWNSLPATRSAPFKSLPRAIKPKQRQCVPKKLSVSFIDD